jgi:hypothetical protein
VGVHELRRATRSRRTSSGVDSDSEPTKVVAEEVRRSRRYGRRFAVVRVRATDCTERRTNGDSPHREQRLVAFFERRIRCSDRLCWSSTGILYVVLPEADRTAASCLVARIEDGLRALPAVTSLSIAIFPDDAMTVAALFGAVDADAVMTADELADLDADLRYGTSAAARPAPVQGQGVTG